MLSGCFLDPDSLKTLWSCPSFTCEMRSLKSRTQQFQCLWFSWKIKSFHSVLCFYPEMREMTTKWKCLCTANWALWAWFMDNLCNAQKYFLNKSHIKGVPGQWPWLLCKGKRQQWAAIKQQTKAQMFVFHGWKHPSWRNTELCWHHLQGIYLQQMKLLHHVGFLSSPESLEPSSDLVWGWEATSAHT